MYTNARFHMPFGKYAGIPFYQIPQSYFGWLLNQTWLDREWPRLREEIREYLANDDYYSRAQRQHQNNHGNPGYQGYQGSGAQEKNIPTSNTAIPLLTAPEIEDFKLMVKLGFQKLALKYHPDTGGNAEDMKRLNKLAEKLKSVSLL